MCLTHVVVTASGTLIHMLIRYYASPACMQDSKQAILTEQHESKISATDVRQHGMKPTSMGVPFRSLLMPSAAKSSPMPLPLGNLHTATA